MTQINAFEIFIHHSLVEKHSNAEISY